MKKKLLMGLFLAIALLVSACAERIPDKRTELDQFHTDPVDLSEHSEDAYSFSVEDVQDNYVILWTPFRTNSTQIRVFNVGQDPIECDLYNTDDSEHPILTCTIEPERSGTFSNLTSAEYYYVGIKPSGSWFDIIIQD